MNVHFRNFLLKSIPYLLSIAGGASLFWLTSDNIGDANLRDLVNNIAASLLSIPLVFLLYDYSNYWISRRLNQTVANSMHDKIDITLINLIVLLRQMMNMRGPFTLKGLNKMATLRPSQISSRIKIRPKHIATLQRYYHDLDELIYHNPSSSALTLGQIQALTALNKNILHLINIHVFHQDRRVAAQYIDKIIRFVIDWIDADASITVRFQQLLNGEVTQNSTPPQTKN